MSFERPSVQSERAKGDSGFVLVMMGLLLIPIIAFTALAVDVSSWYNRATELQRTADAASLAGVIWMPTQAKAYSVATEAAKQNGFIDGTNSITVEPEGEAGSNALTVCVTDSSVTQFFGAVIGGPTTLKRCATSKFNMPIELGSPINYFGGDRASNWSDLGQTDVVNNTPANYATNRPPNSDFGYYNGNGNYYCGVHYEGDYKGYWEYYGRFRFVRTSNYYSWMNVCWESSSSQSINPIPASKDVGFWAAIEGPGTNAGQGDAFSPFCFGLRSNGASSGSSGSAIDCGPSNNTNPQFRTEPSRFGDNYASGYWYVVNTDVASSLQFQVFDASYDKDKGQLNGTGDNKLGGNTTFHTTFTVYDTDDTPLDMSDNTTVLCSVDVTNEEDYQNVWKNLCDNPVSAPADARYYINVRTWHPSWRGNGSNNYALRVVNGTQDSSCVDTIADGDPACYDPGYPQPSLSAIGDMAMYNNLNAGSSQFFLANVGPEYAGKTLLVDLWDVGDSNARVDVTVKLPSATNPEGRTIAECQTRRRKIDKADGSPGDQESSGTAANCSIRATTGSGDRTHNGKWVQFEIKIPTDYGELGGPNYCDPDQDPTAGVGSGCWWQIKYDSIGQTHDNTTWAARIIGDPVRLTQ